MSKLSKLCICLFTLLSTLTSACGSSASPSQENVVEKITPGAVQMLNFESTTTPFSTQSIPSNTPTPTNRLSPSPTQATATDTTAAITTIAPNNATPSCINRAEFVKHLSIGDFTTLRAGIHFAKVWQIKNAGTCTWTQEYALVFVGGDSMNGPQLTYLPHVVPPGETVDLRVDLITPNQAGAHTGNWMLEDNSGNLFGLGEAGDQAIEVIILVNPTPSPTSGCSLCDIEPNPDP